MWELDYKESWAPKNWCSWTVVLEKTLESPLDCKVKPKGNQSWIFIGRTDAEAETPILWPPDAKNWLIWKRPWCWERLKAGGDGEDRVWDSWMALPTWWTLSLNKLQELVKHREAWHAAIREVTKSQTWLSDWSWTELKMGLPGNSSDFSAFPLTITFLSLTIPHPSSILWGWMAPEYKTLQRVNKRTIWNIGVGAGKSQ